jgi:hypothetical protein
MARSSYPFALWFDLAVRSTQLMQASAEVILQRSNRIARMGAKPSLAEQREMRRMVNEKVQASAESATAMSLRAMSSYQTLLWQSVTGRIDTAPLARAARTGSQIASAGLAPFHRRARNNAKRLRK